MAAANLLGTIKAIFSSPTYSSRIPQSVRTDIENNTFGTTDYDFETLNAVYSELVNLIAKAETFSFKYSGVDYDKWNKGRLAVGDVIRDTYVNIADCKPFPKIINTAANNSGVTTVDPYVINHPKMKVAYYFGTYSLQYSVTTTLWEVQKAFLSESAMFDFVAQARGVLPESMQLDRWLIFQNMLGSSDIYAATHDYEIGDDLTAEDAMQMVSDIRIYAKAMQWNTTKYNKLGVLAEGMKGSSVLFINSGIYNLMKTRLMTVYHNDIDFGVDEIVEIPDFGEAATTSGIYAAILDSRGIYLYDTKSPTMWSIYNGAGEYTNTWLNYQGKIGYALHRNAVSFTLTQATA